MVASPFLYGTAPFRGSIHYDSRAGFCYARAHDSKKKVDDPDRIDVPAMLARVAFA